MDLEKIWGIGGTKCETSIGVNRTTYKVGEEYWLTGVREPEAKRLLIEVNVLTALERLNTAITYPQIVRTRAGESIYKEGGYLWRVITNIQGETPSPSDPSVYKKLPENLVMVHHDLFRIQGRLETLNNSILSEVKAYLSQYMQDERIHQPWKRFQSKLKCLNSVLSDAIQSLDQQEKQIIHGDFSFPNIKIEGHSIGVLDFEFVSRDPAVLDLATICLTLIMRSGFSNNVINEMVATCLDSYNRKAKKAISMELLRYAILLRKFDSCCYHQINLLNGIGTGELVERQFSQMERLLHLDWWPEMRR